MRIYEQGHLFFVSLEPGEEIVESFRQLTNMRDWPAAAIWGIGAITDIVLGYYDLKHRRYFEIPLDGEWELASCHGTVSTRDHQPLPHLHVVVSNKDGETRGGHLFRGKISAAGEFVVLPLPSAMIRRYNERIGLALL